MLTKLAQNVGKRKIVLKEDVLSSTVNIHRVTHTLALSQDRRNINSEKKNINGAFTNKYYETKSKNMKHIRHQ